MSGISWNKDAERRRMQRHGIEDKTHRSKDALRREADRLLAGYTGPVERVPTGLITQPPSTVRSGRKVAAAATSAKRDKPFMAKSEPFATAIPRGLVIYCDGACEPNPGIGGWGFVVYRDGVEIHSACGGSAATTNNIMEMTGALMALRWFHERALVERVRLLCDSQYVVKGCNEWRHGWKRKGWRRGVEKELANVELWRELDEALAAVPIILEWVKGHAGVIGNERADELSFMGREAALTAEASDCGDLIAEQLRYVVV